MVNTEDPDQEQSDLGLHCSPRPVCPKLRISLDYFGFCHHLFKYYKCCCNLEVLHVFMKTQYLLGVKTVCDTDTM